MKRPDPTFLHKAENIRGKRRFVTLILVLILSALVLVVSFVMAVASRQREYEELYPDLVGRATDTTTTYEYVQTSATEATTTESETSETTSESTGETYPMPSTHSTESETESTSATTTSLEPDELTEEDYHFPTQRSQVVSHQKRAVMLDNMKNQIEQYTKSLKNVRVGFQYISLKNNEQLGIRELDPIVPAGAFALPINTIAAERMMTSAMSPSEVITYQGHSAVNGSYITSNYSSGKQITLSYLAYLSLSYNDSVAQEMLLERLGGLDQIMPDINKISSFQPYDSEVYYVDYNRKDTRGKGRSTCYDMARYMEYLYHSYVKNPSCYQNVINSLAYSNTPSPIAGSFGDDVKVLHIAGRNTTMNAYTDIALIDAPEPIVVCIYVESSNTTTTATIFSTISGYVAEYINGCY
ncbi:Beta-lactamase class A [Ruminococcaceae bacterium YRB3002]|nr:Beta-lactamase class A [Ruminococcaceae bacterium YRB3002]